MDGRRERGIPGRFAWGLAVLVASVLASTVALGEGEKAADRGPAKEGLDCGRLMACSDECGARCSGISKIGCLLTCKETCSKKGCATAQKAFEDLSGCMKSNCPFKCAGGPSEKCRQCGVEDCTEPRSTCESHRCAGPATPPPAKLPGPADSAAAAADAGR